MIQISQDDLVRALKSFKGLAKQDLLGTYNPSQSEYRKTHAEARREIYAKLIDLVESSGVENACVFAFSEYCNLSSVPENTEDNPVIKGKSQAFEMFFSVFGVTSDKLRTSKSKEITVSQLLDFALPESDYCVQN